MANWEYSIDRALTFSNRGAILAHVGLSASIKVDIKVESSFLVCATDPVTGEAWELGAFATLAQAENYRDAHQEWRNDPALSGKDDEPIAPTNVDRAMYQQEIPFRSQT